MKKYLIIEVDENDADYLSSQNEVTDEQLEGFKPIIEEIKNFKPYVRGRIPGTGYTHRHNFPTLECHREDLGEYSAEEMYGHFENFIEFFDCVPSGEYGIHTIVSIKVLTVLEEIKLL